MTLIKKNKNLKLIPPNLKQLVQERTKELAISEKWHRSIFDNATDGIIVLDKNGVIINVNQKACEIHGFDKNALIGIDISLLEAKADREKYDERMSRILNGESLIYETEHYKKDGNKVLLEVSSKAIDIEGETLHTVFLQGHHGKEEDSGAVDAFAENGIRRLARRRDSTQFQ